MALGGEVHHDVGVLLGEELVHALAVADVNLDEAEVGVIHHGRERGEVAGIGQLVEADDPVVGVLA